MSDRQRARRERAADVKDPKDARRNDEKVGMECAEAEAPDGEGEVGCRRREGDVGAASERDQRRRQW